MGRSTSIQVSRNKATVRIHILSLICYKIFLRHYNEAGSSLVSVDILYPCNVPRIPMAPEEQNKVVWF